MSPKEFDAIVVGTGQAGNPLALELAEAGHRTAVVERGPVGGTCVNRGCTPTKTMVASARVAHLAHRSSDYGIETGQVFVRMSNVRARKRSVVDDFRRSNRSALEEHERVELVEGHAAFVDERTLEIRPAVGDGEPERISAPRIFLNVGARPVVPDIPGLQDVDYLTSTSILELDEVPRHLAVLGGGPVGLEFAQIFSRLGSGVTIIEHGSRLLGREDEDVSECLRDILQDEGITVLTDTATQSIAPVNGDSVSLDMRSPDGPLDLMATHLLVAVGRRPNTDDLGLEKAGLETDEQGYVRVDDHCRTDVEGIWAMGDMTGTAPFTHVAYDDYRVVASHVLEGRKARSRSDRLEPYVVFTDPELGRIGLSESQAEERNVSVRVAKLPMTSWARAIEMDETRGFVKCLVDPETDKIVGASTLAVHGGEILSVLQTAMMGDLPYTAIRDAVYAHPTLAESLENLFADMEA